MEELIMSIVKGLVDNKEQVAVSKDEPAEDGATIIYHVKVHPDDMGRVIGKQGRIAKAIRTITRAASIRAGEKIIVEIDPVG